MTGPDISTVSDRFQTVIPELIRNRMGLKVGDRIRWKEDNGRLVAEKLVVKVPPAKKGSLKHLYQAKLAVAEKTE